jgi:hypothetical protein
MLPTKHKGAYTELVAATWLLSQGYEVFRNVSPHGGIDIIAVCGDTIRFFDVKSWNGLRIPQKVYDNPVANIEILAVRSDGTIKIFQRIERKPIICLQCGQNFVPTRRRTKFCSTLCGWKAKRAWKKTSPSNGVAAP